MTLATFPINGFCKEQVLIEQVPASHTPKHRQNKAYQVCWLLLLNMPRSMIWYFSCGHIDSLAMLDICVWQNWQWDRLIRTVPFVVSWFLWTNSALFYRENCKNSMGGGWFWNQSCPSPLRSFCGQNQLGCHLILRCLNSPLVITVPSCYNAGVMLWLC